MKAEIQTGYEDRLGSYAALIHGNNPPGLVPKLATYSSLLEQHARHGDKLWKIEPLLYPLVRAVEVDLHLATARLLEKPQRSERSLIRFAAGEHNTEPAQSTGNTSCYHNEHHGAERQVFCPHR